MNEKQREERYRQEALDEMYAILAEEAFVREYDPDLPYSSVDGYRGMGGAVDISGS